MKRLENKIAIVTGGTSGIGAGICTAYAKEGATVVVVGRNEERGANVVAEIKAAGGEAVFIQTDVRVEESVKNLINATIEKYGRIDVLVNDAGIGHSLPILDTTTEEWDDVMNTNVKGVFFGIKYALPYLIETKGSIITVASAAAVKTLAGTSVYSASKAAALSITRSVAVNYSSTGVRANIICPGLVNTPILGDVSPELLEATAQIVPLKRIGVPEDIAPLAVYLASDESKYTTGAAFSVDGGLVL